MSVFGKNDSRRLHIFFQTYIFWNFDYISRTYNQINNSTFWFAKVTIILIMIAQVLFLVFFLKKNRTLIPLRSWNKKVLITILSSTTFLYFLLINSFCFISSRKWFLVSSIFLNLNSWLMFLHISLIFTHIFKVIIYFKLNTEFLIF